VQVSRLALYFLGSPRIELAGEETRISRRKSLALLAYLAVTGDSHTRDALATLLWPEQDQSRARNSLRGALVSLRKALGEGWLEADRESVGLIHHPEPVEGAEPSTGSGQGLWLDVAEFQNQLAACQAHGHSPDQVCPACLPLLGKAAELYRGDFMAGFTLPDSPAFDEWQYYQSEGLRGELAGTLERLANAHAAQGEFEPAIAHTRRWVALDPLNEPAQRHLMRLYDWSGQRTAALRQYVECERVLEEELGVPPEEETSQLHKAIKESQGPPPPGEQVATNGVSETDPLRDRYHLGAEIGRGGMGVVYHAFDTLLERDVAIKAFSATALDTEGRNRLLHEARAAAGLNHPNIVVIYDAGEAIPSTRFAKHPERSEWTRQATPFIVMELIQGQSLHDFGVQELDEIVPIARQICAALEHAHTHGIVHRDLKPENVLLTPDGTAKLMDFGLARSVASRLTSEGAITGTVFYLAPELALGQAFDGRADLYALGVMLYELTTGRLPFSGDDPLAVITQHLYAPVVPPRAKNPDIPPTVDALILRLMSKDPRDRPGSAAEVRHVLEQPDLLVRDAAPDEELSVLERIGRGRIVGRERELRQARALWNKVLSGQGQTLLVSGEPGIGKTRLVQELVTQIRVAGSMALEGACYAEGGGPYGPFAQILRRSFRDGVADDLDLPQFVLADLLTLAPALRIQFSDLPPNPPLDPQAEQQRLFESVVAFCNALSDRASLSLVLEDAHWADNSSLSLLRHLARRTRHRRVMIVATYREVELDELSPFLQVLLDLNRERLATCLKLGRLGRDQTAEMLAALFDEEITPEFLNGIYRETEGNPFFVEEVCKALVESGELFFADGRWHRPALMEELKIPQSVRVAIQSRVGKLPETAQETLRLAAVLGREFEFDTLVRAGDLAEDMVISALESAERAQLFEEAGDEGSVTFTFAHALIPGTLYEGVSTLRRRRMHHQVAAAIEALHPNDFEGLAYHCVRAGDQKRARRYYLQAGDRARSLVALEDAAAYYGAALERWPENEQAARAETLRKRGECLYITGNIHEALETFEESYGIFEAVSDRVGAGAVQRLIGRIYWERGEREMSLQRYHRALEILQDGPESVELARAISAVSQMYMLASEFDQAVAWGHRALALAERLGAEDVTVHALNNIGASLVKSDPERGVTMLEESLRRALALGLPADVCRAFNNLGEILVWRTRYEEARAMLEELQTYALRVHAHIYIGSGIVWLAKLDWLTGDWGSALSRRQQILDWIPVSPAIAVPRIWASTVLGCMYNDLGQANAAREELESWLSKARSAAELQTTVPHLGQLARAYAILGLGSETAKLVQDIVDWIDGIAFAHPYCTMPLLFVCQWLASRPGDCALDDAHACLGRLEHADEQLRSPETAACVSEARGRVALAEGDHDRAVQQFRQAVAQWEEMGRPYDQARALGGLGHALVGVDDPTLARAAFDQALEICDVLAAQMEDAELKRSFLNSGLVREICHARVALIALG
jgi:serine/threonine protein kinase/DNA-binding SARP family transcriptional activator